MDKTALISMFVSFVTSSDLLKYIPQDRISELNGDVNNSLKWKPPSYCNTLDCPEFTVVKSTKDYEERIYKVSNWVSTNLQDVGYKSAQSEMFSKLFKYISGDNEKKQKIKMTCPVTNRIIPGQGPACESNFTMSFFIAPKVADPPRPSNKDVFLNQVPELHVYVRQFSGFTPNFESWRKNAVELGAALDKSGHAYEKSYYFTAGYDAPFKLFNRHNEIWFMKK